MTNTTHLPLITGCSGRLGRALSDLIEDNYAETFPEAVFATRDEIDITDYFRLCFEVERIAPTVVVNCAAYAHVDGCEMNRDQATLVNARGARNVARAANAVGARIIQVSTDLVFDGAADQLYTEEDPPNPLSHYAATKLDGERAVMEENPDHVILRSSWFYGPWPKNRYPEVFLTMLNEGRRFRMVSDRLGSPTYIGDLARAIVNVMVTPYRGLLHFANTGAPTSRYHLLKELADHMGVDTRPMSPIAEAAWSEDVAPRPSFSALDPGRYTAVTGHRPRSWSETFDDYVKERSA